MAHIYRVDRAQQSANPVRADLAGQRGLARLVCVKPARLLIFQGFDLALTYPLPFTGNSQRAGRTVKILSVSAIFCEQLPFQPSIILQCKCLSIINKHCRHKIVLER